LLCEPVVTQPPVSRELVAEFDPLSISTPKLSDKQSILVEMPVGNDIAKIEDFSCLLEAGDTKSSRANTENTSDEIIACSDVDVVDSACSSWSQSLLSSAESVEHRTHNACDSEGTEPHPEPACSTPDVVDDDRGMSFSSSHKGTHSYLEVWTCSSTQNAAETGQSSSAAVFLPEQREIIKSDESSSPPFSPSSDYEDVSIVCQPVPKKRSFPQLSTSDQSTKSPQPLSNLVPLRAAPSPPYHISERKMPPGISKSIAIEDISNESDEMPASPESDSKLNLLVSRGIGSPQPLTADEEQTMTMSFESSGGVSPLLVGGVSSSPQPKPRESPRQPAVSSDQFRSPPRLRERMAPLVLPAATQKLPSSTSTTTPSPVDRVIGVGGVGGATSKMIAGMPGVISSAVLSPSPRTPPVPPPKHRKPSKFTFCSTTDGDTTDDDLDSADIKDSKFWLRADLAAICQSSYAYCGGHF